MTHPSSCCAFAADIGEDSIVARVRCAKWHFLNSLVNNKRLQEEICSCYWSKLSFSFELWPEIDSTVWRTWKLISCRMQIWFNFYTTHIFFHYERMGKFVLKWVQKPASKNGLAGPETELCLEFAILMVNESCFWLSKLMILFFCLWREQGPEFITKVFKLVASGQPSFSPQDFTLLKKSVEATL